jgi:hypothetical protein
MSQMDDQFLVPKSPNLFTQRKSQMQSKFSVPRSIMVGTLEENSDSRSSKASI